MDYRRNRISIFYFLIRVVLIHFRIIKIRYTTNEKRNLVWCYLFKSFYTSIQQNTVSGGISKLKLCPQNRKVDEAIQEAFQSKVYTGVTNRWKGQLILEWILCFILIKKAKYPVSFRKYDRKKGNYEI